MFSFSLAPSKVLQLMAQWCRSQYVVKGAIVEQLPGWLDQELEHINFVNFSTVWNALFGSPIGHSDLTQQGRWHRADGSRAT